MSAQITRTPTTSTVSQVSAVSTAPASFQERTVTAATTPQATPALTPGAAVATSPRPHQAASQIEAIKTVSRTQQPSASPSVDLTPKSEPPTTIVQASNAIETKQIDSPTDESNSASNAFFQVAIGENHACALQRDGRVYCWGENDKGQLDVPSDKRFIQVTSGWRFSCGLEVTGAVSCWGRNEYGQVNAPYGRYTTVDAGWDHACATRIDGAVCWGREADGRIDAPTGIRFSQIAAGAEHSCGLTVSGSLRCWGKNDNSRGDSLGGPFEDLDAGITHTCVLTDDGQAICQGTNTDGQSNPPDKLFSKISAGEDITCGIDRLGEVHCWGGTRWSQTEHAQLHTLPGHFRSLSVGWNGVCPVTYEGYTQCWGYTLSGALLLPYLPQEPDHPFLRHALSLPYHDLRLSEAIPREMLDQSVDILPWPSGGSVVIDRQGRVSLHRTNGSANMMLDLTDKINSKGGERGLLSAALDPRFASTPFLYLYYTLRFDDNDKIERARLSRFLIDVESDQVLRNSELVILDIERPKEHAIHFGGALRFGPDGMLYLGIGDSRCRACPQDTAELHGKIVRLDVRNSTSQQPYQVPRDNPFNRQPTSRPEIWAYGLRNPWRMSFDEITGQLWVGDVGRAVQEEVSIVTAGANLGWPIFEGTDCFTIPNNATDELRNLISGYGCEAFEGATEPIVTYGRRWGCPGDSTCPQKLGNHPTITYGTPERCAVVGGVVYRGKGIPWLDGTYLFGDFCSGEVWALDGDASDGWRMVQIADLPYPVSSFGTDSSSEVYVLTFGGPIYRLVEDNS